ncbi:hypothetical protein GCM10027053_12980 [Intrasporangium mesophilum]
MNVSELATDLLARHDPDAVADGFTERLTLAAAPRLARRTTLSPEYLTDLGVRRSADPSRFWRAHLALFGWDVSYSVQDNAAWIACLDLDDAVLAADATVLLVGDFDNAAAALAPRVAELTSGESTDVLPRLGVLLAAVGDLRAVDVFDVVVSRGTVRQATMARHRRAATQIKRGNDLEGGDHTLDVLLDDTARLLRDGAITERDATAIAALVCNLRALVHMRRMDITAARYEIDRAMDLVQGAGDVVVTPDEALRYQAEISLNDAQLAMVEGDHSRASRVLETNIDRCRRDSPEYLSEALSAAGVGLIRERRFNEAVIVLVQAVDLIRHEASPVRLEMTRKLLATALARSGRADQGCRVLYAMHHDELGFWGTGAA